MGNSASLFHGSVFLRTFSTAVLLSFPGGPLAVSAGPLFSVGNLGQLGSSGALPTGINGSGAAVGWLVDGQGDLEAMSFQGGVAVSLGTASQANGINDAGAVIGTSFENNNPTVTKWLNGQTLSLGVGGYGTAINDSGQIGGGYVSQAGGLHAFISTNGVLTDLTGSLGGAVWSSVYGLNASGQAAGTSMTGNGPFHAFFYDGSTAEDLGTLGGGNSYGLALNDSGTVVGNSQNAQGYSRAFAWNAANGLMTDLGTLGGTQSYAYGVNNSGEVVGFSYTSDGSQHGFLYSNGVLVDLNSMLPVGSGWTIDGAYGVNGAGAILADGTSGGQHYAVELTPEGVVSTLALNSIATPEPAALAMVGAGLIVIARLNRGKRPEATDVAPVNEPEA